MELNKVKKNAPLQISNYVNITMLVMIYIVLAFLLKQVAMEERLINILGIKIQASSLRGVFTGLQMLLSIYLVMKEKKAGYVVGVALNIYTTSFATFIMIHTRSGTSLPGIICALTVLVIMTFLFTYQGKMAQYMTEIMQRKEVLEASEGKLSTMAFYDSLTSLPNKDLFEIQLEETIRLAKRNGSRIAVMLIDIDSFKSINDTMGHTGGDKVLKTVADRFKSCVKEDDMVARFSGDEFLICIGNGQKEEDFYEITQNILKIFDKPVVAQDMDFVVTASAGVAIYPVDGDTPEALIKNADIAMYLAKKTGKNQCAYCTVEMKAAIVKELKIKNNLYTALENNELFLQYQPQVSARTQEIMGFEALIRWNNAEYGMISPEVFIPLAEKTGMIIPIGLWIFQTACEQYAKNKQLFNKSYRMSINVSLEQLKDAQFSKSVGKILEETRVNPSDIQIEITESIAFKEEPYILKRIKELRSLGITISIDDFGTGYSSFNRLRTFPIDLIKIDKEFVQGISQNSHKEKEIVKSMIRLAKNLGIHVLAEGVEWEEEYAFLRDEKCDEIQGFYFYKPMTGDQIKEIIYNQKKKLIKIG